MACKISFNKNFEKSYNFSMVHHIRLLTFPENRAIHVQLDLYKFISLRKCGSVCFVFFLYLRSTETFLKLLFLFYYFIIFHIKVINMFDLDDIVKVKNRIIRRILERNSFKLLYFYLLF